MAADTMISANQVFQQVSFSAGVAISRDTTYCDCMRRELVCLIDNFITILGKTASDKADDSRLCPLIEKLCADLQQSLIQCRSLPPCTEGVVVEIGVVYNLVFADLLKSRCSRTQQQPSQVLSTHGHTVLWSLQRVQHAVGTSSSHTERDRDGLPEMCSDAQRVGRLLLVLLNTLDTNHDKELKGCVGLLACLWALITLFEKGPYSPLPWLTPLVECPPTADKMAVKFGFLLIAPPAQNGKERDKDEAHHQGFNQNFAQFLLAVSSFHQQKWSDCRRYVSNLSGPLWTSLADLLKGHALLGGGSSAEAIQHLLEGVQRPGTNPAVLSQLHRLLAAAYTDQGLPSLALHALCQSHQLQPECPSTLMSLADHASLHPDTDRLHIDCLTTLVQVTEKNQGKERSIQDSLLNTLLLEIIAFQPRPTLSQAVYRLASCCSQLERFDEASKAYMKLIQVYEKPEVKQSTPNQNTSSLCLPDFLTVCREACQVLLKTSQHKQCLQLCDKVLDALSSSTVFTKPSLNWSVFPLCSQSGDAADESVNILGTDSQRGSWACVNSRERSMLCTEIEGQDTARSSWQCEENRSLLELCKAECLVAAGEDSATVDLLHRALQRLQQSCVENPCSGSASAWGPAASTGDPTPSFAPTGPDLTSEDQTSRTERWQRLTQQVCVYLCDALLRCDQPLQALHAARLAAQIRPENEVSQYYLVSTLDRLGRRGEGYQTWLCARRLLRNKGSVRLHNTLQDIQKRISSLEEEQQARSLGCVTDKQKLDLDLLCLTMLAEQRVNK